MALIYNITQNKKIFISFLVSLVAFIYGLYSFTIKTTYIENDTEKSRSGYWYTPLLIVFGCAFTVILGFMLYSGKFLP